MKRKRTTIIFCTFRNLPKGLWKEAVLKSLILLILLPFMWLLSGLIPRNYSGYKHEITSQFSVHTTYNITQSYTNPVIAPRSAILGSTKSSMPAWSFMCFLCSGDIGKFSLVQWSLCHLPGSLEGAWIIVCSQSSLEDKFYAARHWQKVF